MSLFKRRYFVSSAGIPLSWEIDCKYLTDEDWNTLAYLYVSLEIPFKEVYGIPNGGLKFCNALRKYSRNDESSILLADDVITTGKNMNMELKRMRENLHPSVPIHGVVAFCRGDRPAWITALFSVNTTREEGITSARSPWTYDLDAEASAHHP